MTPLIIGGVEIAPGETKKIQLEMPPLYTATRMSIPVHVQRGKRSGPVMFVSAAIHGDELNGIEIISRLLKSKSLANLRGTLIAVPMVNVYGVLNQSRYMPDRRDLNRSFPGSKKGSLAGIIADLFLQEIVSKCDVGIDLHTGAIHRSNLPQIRGNLDNAQTLAMAEAFGVPVLLNSNLRDGSLRQSAADLGVNILLYEAGEALRYDELSIRAGVKGIVNVMRSLGMLAARRTKIDTIQRFVARQSGWVRAQESGLVNHIAQLGDHVLKGAPLATISDPYGTPLTTVLSPTEGVVIGKQNIPLAQEGEAMYHIAYFHAPDSVAEHVELLQDNLTPVPPTFDET
ncbi:succinylglutamate desuccinylase/aspartoacylase family protein [Paraglaciecola polaris]|uniref:Succinylglutamate desuccinylase/aspartoacylase n=1 Tax=Paraglaciecola polaris LMG 21857 TaxID=1129793 RepID=K6ZGN4_9ALTE|nr:succinylglutamate desuccinylase/aspartoacylase family protein [Paraglaciecola polaris]GAC35181.1 succinylglutamate desuccinylase/aspartoacylase [Paraglaciecola polaris LMG 21857]|tara:strand:+ start:1713 stop:2741 length:1029 start_codon:yes stop_codon:yes gene_type:complete